MRRPDFLGSSREISVDDEQKEVTISYGFAYDEIWVQKKFVFVHSIGMENRLLAYDRQGVPTMVLSIPSRIPKIKHIIAVVGNFVVLSLLSGMRIYKLENELQEVFFENPSVTLNRKIGKSEEIPQLATLSESQFLLVSNRDIAVYTLSGKFPKRSISRLRF
jgi:hypothetical protein